MLRIIAFVVLSSSGCVVEVVHDPGPSCGSRALGGEGEGEGEGSTVAGEGEGEGGVVAAGEGEGEGAGVIVGGGEGEGEGSVVSAGEGEGEGSAPPPTTVGTDPKVTWDLGCWEPFQGQQFQAMSFDLTTSTAKPLNGTLFFNTRCDPVDGTDNLNDTGGTIPSGGWLFWFIHHPDNVQTSAIWWIGDDLSTSSPCIDYSTAPVCQ